MYSDIGDNTENGFNKQGFSRNEYLLPFVWKKSIF